MRQSGRETERRTEGIPETFSPLDQNWNEFKLKKIQNLEFYLVPPHLKFTLKDTFTKSVLPKQNADWKGLSKIFFNAFI